MITAKDQNTRPCSTCAHKHMGQCDLYQDDITGADAYVQQARHECKGDKWELRENIAAIANALLPTVTYHEDRIETPKATVYKDPPPKLYE